MYEYLQTQVTFLRFDFVMNSFDIRVAQNAKIWKCFAPYAKSNANDTRDHASFKEIAVSLGLRVPF